MHIYTFVADIAGHLDAADRCVSSPLRCPPCLLTADCTTPFYSIGLRGTNGASLTRTRSRVVCSWVRWSRTPSRCGCGGLTLQPCVSTWHTQSGVAVDAGSAPPALAALVRLDLAPPLTPRMRRRLTTHYMLGTPTLALASSTSHSFAILSLVRALCVAQICSAHFDAVWCAWRLLLRIQHHVQRRSHCASQRLNLPVPRSPMHATPSALMERIVHGVCCAVNCVAGPPGGLCVPRVLTRTARPRQPKHQVLRPV